MMLQEKISIIEECMDLDAGTLKVEDFLSSYYEWDSVSALSIISMIDTHFNKMVSGNDLKNAKTVADIIAIME